MRFRQKIERYLINHLWRYRSIFNLFLVPFSSIYFFIFQYRKAFARGKKASIPVICIGNITIGGAGKTPVALAFGKILQSMGYAISFIGHGYKSNQKKYMPYIVVDSDIHNAHDVGDEALLLNMIAPTFIAKDRALAIEVASSLGAEVAIMDDGLQNFAAKKELSVIVIDSNYLLGNGLLLPAGPLREPALPALKKADLIIVSGYDDRIIDDAVVKLTSSFGSGMLHCLKEKILYSIIQPVNIEQFYNNSFLVMTGISNPNKLLGLLMHYNIDIKESHIFPDHHIFSDIELEKIYNQAISLNYKVLTTRKDFVKIPKKYYDYTVVLDIDAKMSNTELIQSKVREIFNNFPIAKSI